MMLRLIALTLLPLTVGAPAIAQGFAANYEVLGRFDLHIGEDTQVLWALRDTGDDSSLIERHDIFGQVFYNIGAIAEGADGNPANPQIEVQLGPASFPPREVSSVSLIMHDAMFSSDPEVGGSTETVSVEWGDNGAVTLNFRSFVVPVKYDNGALVAVAPGGPLLEVEGAFQGTLPIE